MAYTRRTLLAAPLAALPAMGQTLPRKAEDYTFQLPNGQDMKLSQFKGKHLAVAFMLST